MSWDQGGFGGGPQPPDPRELLEKFKGRIPAWLAGGLLGLVGVIALALWASSGFYVVKSDEQGVIKRFGEYVETTESGLHWHLPYPIEEVLKPKVTEVKRLEIGFRIINPGPPARYQSIPEEALMLTGDENIVSCEFIVQYQIRDAKEYLFNVHRPDEFVRHAAEAAMREVVGRNMIDDVLTESKDKIQIEARDLMQSILNDSAAGVVVHNVKLQDVYPPTQVIAAFRDVASAREDRETLKNQAEAYANDILPRARGEAQQRINEAKGYKERVINTAEGDAARFLQLYEQYTKAREVTRKRLYLDAMEEVLRKASIVVSGAEGGVVPMLPIKSFTGEGGAK